jgi:transposase-like protein
MHIEAMNFSGMGHAEYAAALGLSPHSLRIWRDRLEQSGNEIDWRSLLHPSARAQLSSAANCARCKYRLTPQEADGRSNRRRFTDEQKRAMVQDREAGCRRGGGLPPAWHCYQPAVPLAGPVRSDSPKGVTTGDRGALRRRKGRGSIASPRPVPELELTKNSALKSRRCPPIEHPLSKNGVRESTGSILSTNGPSAG